MFHAHNFFPEFLYRNGVKEPLPANLLDRSLPFNHLPEGTGVAKVKGAYAPHLIEQDAMNFIVTHRDQPFFLYLALNLPHNNGEKARATGDGSEVFDLGEFADRDWPARRARLRPHGAICRPHRRPGHGPAARTRPR